jgi:hypothetical protein
LFNIKFKSFDIENITINDVEKIDQIYDEFNLLIKKWIIDMLLLTRSNKEKYINLNEINVLVNYKKLCYNKILDVFEGK